MVKDLPVNTTHDIGLVLPEGDLMAMPVRDTGWGPTPLIGVDLYRVEKGKVTEHRDTGRQEVLDTAFGLPIFRPTK